MKPEAFMLPGITCGDYRNYRAPSCPEIPEISQMS